jgi:hypothetical protein
MTSLLPSIMFLSAVLCAENCAEKGMTILPLHSHRDRYFLRNVFPAVQVVAGDGGASAVVGWSVWVFVLVVEHGALRLDGEDLRS